MSPLVYLAIIFLLYVLKTVYVILIKPELSPVSRLPGPNRPSFLWGCMGQIFQSKPGDWHEAMIEQYGKTFAYKGFMNTNRFCTVDTKTLHHILSRPDVYQKPAQVRKGLGRILGEGLLFAECDAHRKQRKIMNPSFSIAHIRSLMPTFYAKAQVVRDIWASSISSSVSSENANKPRAIVNVLDTLSRMALDIIGLTGFDYPFDALHGIGRDEKGEYGNELAQAFATVLNHPGAYGWWNIVINWFPILYKIPTASERRIQNAIDTLHRVGGQLIAQKKLAIMSELSPSPVQLSKPTPVNVGKDSVKGKDFLSLLIRANMASDLSPAERLSDADVMSQISTFVVAGHETTSTSLSWTLHALALHPHVQDRLREELLSVGSDEPSLEVLESLVYLDAVVREALRWCSIVPSSIRTCMRDDVVPIEGGTKTIKIKEGDGIFVPIVSLNRLKDVWGPDASEFKPERWLTPMPSELKEKQKQVPGVYSDLMTFIGGPRSCIGVKFAVVEMKCVLFTLLRSVSVSLPPRQEVIARTTIVTRPLVKGREDEGNMLPLFVECVD